MTTRQLPHYWTLEQAARRLFALLLWRSALRQREALELQWRDLNFAGATPTITARKGKGGRSRVVPAHPELVEAFRLVPKRRPNSSFHAGPRPDGFPKV